MISKKYVLILMRKVAIGCVVSLALHAIFTFTHKFAPYIIWCNIDSLCLQHGGFNSDASRGD